eukprot:scpid17250/ scgid1085/ NACHT, LRR and PYD domains-containing protein 3
MYNNEVKALNYLRGWLKERLHNCVDDLLDRLISNGVFTGGDAAVSEIRSEKDGHKQVDILLRRLVAIRGKKGVGVFPKLCEVLRDIGRKNTADRVETEARTYEKVGGKFADLGNCQLYLEGLSLSEQVHQVVVEYERRLGTKQKKLEQCLNRLDEKLRRTCVRVSERADNVSLHNLVTDTRTCFIPMQAVSQQEALRSPIHRHHRSDSNTKVLQGREVEKRGKTFCLEHPKQLLMKGYSGAISRESANSGDTASAATSTDSAEDVLVKRCMLIGGAGQGKTTVCRKILSEFLEKERTELRQFKYVFYIPCRSMERVTTEDWIVLLGLKSFTADESHPVMEYLATHSAEVLVIFDGVDEAGPGFHASSAALALIKNNSDDDSSNAMPSRLPDATVIVTSRPCQLAYDLVPLCTLYFRLTGFSETQLKEFCFKHLDRDQAAAKTCVQQLAETSSLALKKAIQSTPLLAALLCQQFSDTLSLPRSVTSFYTEFLSSSVVKLEERRKKKFGNVSLAEDVYSQLHGGRTFRRGEKVSIRSVLKYQLEKHVADVAVDGCDPHAIRLIQALQELYDLCLDGLCANELSFAHSSLSDHALSVCVELGLVTSASIEPVCAELIDRFSLIHATVQEWCAARSASVNLEFVSVVAGCVECIGVDEDSWPFWKFLCGSVRYEHLYTILRMVWSATPRTNTHRRRKKLHLFLMQCLLENELTLNLEGETITTSDDCLSADDLRTACYVAAASCLTSDGIDLDGEHLDSVDVMAICVTMQLVHDVKNLVLSHCNLSHDHFVKLAQILDRAVEVNITGNDVGGSSLEVIASELSQSTRNNPVLLDMRNARLTHGRRDGASLSRCLQHASIKRLYIHGCDLGNAGLAAFASTLKPCPHLRELSIGQCCLGKGSTEHLIMILQQAPRMVNMWVNDNMLGNDEVDSLLSAVQECHAMENLVLDNNPIDVDVFSSIQRLFQERRRNEKAKSATDPAPHFPSIHLWLCGKDIGRQMLEDLVQSTTMRDDVVHISSFRIENGAVKEQSVNDLLAHVQGFLLGYAREEILPALAAYVASDNDLVYLNVTQSQMTDSGVTLLATEGLARNSHIQYFNLSLNAIRLGGIVAVLRAVSVPQSAVRALIIDFNPVFENVDRSCRDYQAFRSLLLQCRNLRFLSFANTGMTDEIGSDVLESLRHHTSLKWINLAGNRIADGTVATFVDVLKDIPTLKRITLANNQITDLGVRLLLASPDVSDMEAVWLKFNECNVSLFERPLYDLSSRYSDDYDGAGLNNIIMEYISSD